MERRTFLLSTLASVGGLTLGRAFLARALGAPAQPGTSPFGPLLEPDANGLMLPEGFTSRIIATALQPVAGLPYVYKPWPDGAATFATDDGGWILVSNSENPPPAGDIPLPIDALPQDFPVGGGVSAIKFDADGTIVDAYEILSGSRSNCAGGATPWGTWLSCEEFEADDPLGVQPYDGGVVYECDPTGAAPAIILDPLGHFKHENAAVDPVGKQVYLSEDLADGLFYRFTPDVYPDLTAGTLEAAVVGSGDAVTWVVIDDPAVTGGESTRAQGVAKGATTFDGGEGCVHDDGFVFLTTKNDDRVWVLDIGAQTMTVLYDAAEFPEPVLSGVDHIIAQPDTGNLVVGEDGGNLEAVMIDRTTLAVFPIMRMTGNQHGQENPTPIPTVSEVSGLAFNPAGDRLYFSSQRGLGFGITYEVAGPWGEVAGRAGTTTTTAATEGGGGTLPATGATGLPTAGVALGAFAAGVVAWRTRRAATAPPSSE